MNNPPARCPCQRIRHNACVSDELLAVDPVSAAQCLLGSTITSRGVSAMIVEVEAYGGPANGLSMAKLKYPLVASSKYPPRAVLPRLVWGSPFGVGRLSCGRSCRW